MIELSNYKQYKTLIIQVPTTSNIPNLSNLSLDPTTSRIEVVMGTKYTYYYCSLNITNTGKRWAPILTQELNINLTEAITITKGGWMKAVNHIYFVELRGEWGPNSYQTFGEASIRYSADSIVNRKSTNQGELVAQVEQIYEADPDADWENDAEKVKVLETIIPDFWKHRRSNIIKEVGLWLKIKKAATLTLAEKKMVMVINGPSEVGKTPLARLVMQYLGEQKVIHPNNTKLCKAKRWDRSLPSGTINGYEAITWEEFGPSHFNLDVFTMFSDPDPDDLRVMYGSEHTRNLKVTLITSTTPIFKWITPDTNSLSDLWQVAKRTYFSFQVVGKPTYYAKDKDDVHWKVSKDRVYLYGNIQLDILSILLELVPHMADEPLAFHFTPSRLGTLLLQLHRNLLPLLLEECSTIYLEEHIVPIQYQMYTYKATQCFPKQTVKVFQYTRDWLQTKIKEIAGHEWGFHKQPIFPTSETRLQLDTPTATDIIKEDDELPLLTYLKTHKEFYLDTETYSFEKKNPMSNLGLRTIQVDHIYTIWEDLTPEQKETIIETFRYKSIYVFNLNFDISQLKHAGFIVEENSWYDIALLARACANLEMERIKPFSLNALALHFLGINAKEKLIDTLLRRYKVRSKDKLYSCKGLVKDETFKEYALNDIFLTQQLHEYFKNHTNYQLWKERLSRLHYYQWEDGFRGVAIDIKDINHRVVEMTNLKSKILDKLPDITLGTDSKSRDKGWNTPKIVDKWLKENFTTSDLEGIDTAPSGIYSFGKEGRATLLAKFPDHPILRALGDLSKKSKTLGDIKGVRDKQEDGILRYGYKMLGTATGRFTAASPAFHNFAKRPPGRGILSLSEEQEASEELLTKRYNMRGLLLNQSGVFSLDFKNQENRMSAYLTNDQNAANLFIRGGDQHSEEANKLGVSREMAKIVVHGLTYDMQGKGLARRLTNEGFPTTPEEGYRLQQEFEASHPQLFTFKKQLRHVVEYQTPLYGRWMKLKPKDKTNWIIQGSCSELILEALSYLHQTNQMMRVSILPHFHDELILKCLICQRHQGREPCENILGIKSEIENLYPFVWPQSDIKVFELGVK